MALTFNLGLGSPPTYDVAVVGGGPAGATAALYASRSDLKTVVLDKSASAGALAITSKIANYPGVPDEITGAELLERMRAQASGFGAEFIQAQVISADLRGAPKTLATSAGEYSAQTVILATGKMGRKNKVPGEDTFLGRGVSYCATCDAAFFRDKTVAVVGATEHAIEEAIFTAQFAREVLLLVPGEKLTAAEYMVEQAVTHPKLRIEYRRPMREIVGGSTVTGIRVGAGAADETLPVDGVFIFLAGNAPILDFIDDELSLTEEGCVVFNRDRSTNIPGVFAVGDLLCSYIQQAVIAAADGAIAAMAAERYVRGRKKARSDWG